MTQDDSVAPVGATYFVSVLSNCHLTSEGEKFKSIVIGEDPILEYIYISVFLFVLFSFPNSFVT
jgi:uncharacterized membrane protein